MCTNLFPIIIIAAIAISADFQRTVNKNYISEEENFGVCANGMFIYKKCNRGRCPHAHACEHNYCCPILPSQSSTPYFKLTTSTAKLPTTSSYFARLMTDFYDWRFINGSTSNGIYRINPGYGLDPFDVYCDMMTDGGGWTVIQRRVDASLEFYNNTWQQYKVGFNNGLDRNLWLGNERIHVLSSHSNVILRVDINGDRLTNPNTYFYGKYYFSISDEANNYTLQISHPIEGNASDANSTIGFYRNKRMPFSTIDKASTPSASICANVYQYGGWWFDYYGHDCTTVALNGKYNPIRTYGFKWYTQAINQIRPIGSEMKIRPR